MKYATKILNTIKKAFAYILTVICIFVALFSLFIISDYQGRCLSDGNVWDYSRNECREDCLVWGAEFGCIQLSPLYIKKIKQCQKPTGCLDNNDYKTICLDNHKAWNNKIQKCHLLFNLADCFKLTGNWIYPDICNK